MRATALCLLGLALTFCGPPAAVAKKAKKTPSACQKLNERYTDVATSHKLVTVVRGNDETGRISACVLPRGKVRTLASWDDGLGRDFASVVDTAGLWVLVDEGHRDQYGGVSRYLERTGVRGNRRFGLASYGCQLWYSPSPSCPDGTDYDEVGIARNGAVAVELSDLAAGTTALHALSPSGMSTKLADGAVDALRVTSTQIRWKQSGVSHTAPLPE